MSALEQTVEISSWNRLGEYLRAELALYPGRISLIVRIVAACTLSMVLIMVFRIPGAALGAYFPILLSRDSPRATLRAGFRTSVVCTLGTAELLFTATLLIASPVTHLLWVLGNLLLVFFLISALEAYDAAVAFGFMVTTAITIWDLPIAADVRVTRTLFALLSIVTGCAVSVFVEYVFAQTHSRDAILEGIGERLGVVSRVLNDIAAQEETEPAVTALLRRYVRRGTGDLRERLAHADYGVAYREQLAAAVALSGRLVELTAQLTAPAFTANSCDRAFCSRIARNIEWIHTRLGHQETPEWLELSIDGERCLPLLVELERTVELIAESFHTDLDGRSHGLQLPAPGEQRRRAIFAHDAFHNREHFKFALRGTLAAGACYLAYMSVGWNTLGAAVATCMLTALKVTGAARHKQLLRFSGVLIGACGLGILSQAVILPQIDSIQVFALVFAAVIAIGAWVGTSSPRLAYCGAQIVLAYDLVNLNSFAVNPSLVPARDAILGILLGSAAMWLIFDRLWTKSTWEAMRDLLLSGVRDVAHLQMESPLEAPAHAEARLWSESERLTRKFDELRALVDFSAFEGKPSSIQELHFSAIIQELQPQLRAIMMVKSGLLLHQVKEATDIYRDEVEQSQRLANEELLESVRLLEEMNPETRGFGPRAEGRLLAELKAKISLARKSGHAEAVTELRLCASLVELSLHLRNSVTRAFLPEETVQHHDLVA